MPLVLLSGHQFGFRPGSSIEEALIAAITMWHKYLNDKVDTAAVDLSKAFDTVPHQNLLQALSNIDISNSLYD